MLKKVGTVVMVVAMEHKKVGETTKILISIVLMAVVKEIKTNRKARHKHS